MRYSWTNLYLKSNKLPTRLPESTNPYLHNERTKRKGRFTLLTRQRYEFLTIFSIATTNLTCRRMVMPILRSPEPMARTAMSLKSARIHRYTSPISHWTLPYRKLMRSSPNVVSSQRKLIAGSPVSKYIPTKMGIRREMHWSCTSARKVWILLFKCWTIQILGSACKILEEL